jgi:hypothetical protein
VRPRTAVLARTLALLALCLTLLVPAVRAEAPETDGVRTEGWLTDDEFYRLATCGAAPGGKCRGEVLRWKKRTLTLRLDRRLTPGGGSLQYELEDRLWTAIRHAVAEVNSVRAGIRLKVINGASADITVRATTRKDGDILAEEAGLHAPGTMGVGYVTVWSNQRNQINEAVILISTAITDSDLTSVMLEEVTQSLGFLYDIENPLYEGVSILSQTSNETTVLTGQDARLLRRHYPP